jgi:site-specific DNA-methyltransferase (adenine-specific)
LARNGLTKNTNGVNVADDDIVNEELTNVKWVETHFRALLKHLPYSDGDNAMMRAQVKAVRAIIARAGEKDKRFGQTQKTVTAKWISELAGEYAWHVKLAKHMRDNLVKRVPIRDRIGLLKSIYRGDYGDKDDAKMFVKFNAAVMKLNEQALGVILYEDDSLRRIPMLEDNSIALVITDPPYNVTEHEWDKVGTPDEYIDFMRKWLTALRPKLTDDYHLFFFCDPDYASRIETEIIMADEWPLLSRVIWWNRSLPSGRQPDMRFVRTWQMCFHIGTHGLNFAPEWSDARFDVQSYAAPNGNTKDGGFHPTGKPQKLIEYLVQLGSKPTDIVLDPFAGGGTTGAACGEIQQRRCILIEMSDEYCSVIEQRLQIRREQ